MRTPTKAPYAGIICPHHGQVDLDMEEYMDQMRAVDSLWKCPCCRSASEFDEERYEEIHGIGEES